MTDADTMAANAWQHFAGEFAGCATPEEIARALAAPSTGGPRHWCGQRILQSLGVIAEGSEATN